MEVSGEVADLVVREGLQATEAAVKLAGSGVKNVAAFLLALAKSNYKVVGKTGIKRLLQDGAPSVVVPIQSKDFKQFQEAAKRYGVLYTAVRPKDSNSGAIDVISNQNYAAQLNAVMESMGYPIPKREESPSKKEPPRVRPEPSLPERGSGLTKERPDKPSVRGKLEALREAAEALRHGPQRQKEHTR